MADYKSMYHKIFNKVSDVIAELQIVQQQTESMYLEAGEPNIKIIEIAHRPEAEENEQ